MTAKRVFLAVCVAGLGACSAAPGADRSGDESGVETRTPLEFHDLYPFVRVPAADGTVLTLLPNTGAHSVILAKDCLKFFPQAKYVGTTEAVVQGRGVALEDYDVLLLLPWDSKGPPGRVSFVSRENVPLFWESGLDGFLGSPAFAGQLVVFDYVGRELRVGGKRVDGPTSLLRRIGHLPVVQAQLGNVEGAVVLDTGAAYCIVDPTAHARSGLPAPVAVQKGGRTEHHAKAALFRVGQYQADGLRVIVRDPGLPVQGLIGVAGNHLFLRSGGLIIDDRMSQVGFPHASYANFKNSCRIRADQSDRDAMFALFEVELAESPDPATAVSWLRKAADAGHPFALHTLGLALEAGDLGLKKNPTEAILYFQRASLAGVVPSKTRLAFALLAGRGTEKNVDEALRLLEQAARAADRDAQGELGAVLSLGAGGVPKNEPRGIEWLRRAAERGLSGAQLNLGVCYFKGTGVPKDVRRALEWYQKAAGQGDEIAMYNIGAIYEKGLHGDPNVSEALQWYRRSAALKYAPAEEALKRLTQQ